jgi:hypothetical protein
VYGRARVSLTCCHWGPQAGGRDLIARAQPDHPMHCTSAAAVRLPASSCQWLCSCYQHGEHSHKQGGHASSAVPAEPGQAHLLPQAGIHHHLTAVSGALLACCVKVPSCCVQPVALRGVAEEGGAKVWSACDDRQAPELMPPPRRVNTVQVLAAQQLPQATHQTNQASQQVTLLGPRQLSTLTVWWEGREGW